MYLKGQITHGRYVTYEMCQFMWPARIMVQFET